MIVLVERLFVIALYLIGVKSFGVGWRYVLGVLSLLFGKIVIGLPEFMFSMSVATVLVELTFSFLLPEFTLLGFKIVVWNIHHFEH